MLLPVNCVYICFVCGVYLEDNLACFSSPVWVPNMSISLLTVFLYLSVCLFDAHEIFNENHLFVTVEGLDYRLLSLYIGFCSHQSYDNFFQPISFPFHRGEKLYVTKDKRLKSNWRKKALWSIGLALLALALLIGILAACEYTFFTSTRWFFKC